MQRRSVRDAESLEEAQRDYFRSVAGTASPADEVAKLADLRDCGVLTEDEFAAQKARILS